MKKLSILVAASVALFAACSKDDSTIQNLADEKFYASSVVSRTTMGDNGTSVHWVDGDLVSIFNKTTDNLQYKATAVNGTSAELVYAGGIRMAATMSENFALYPYDANATLNNGVIATSIPAAQTHSADANLHHSIMVAKSASNSLSFVNATALLRFDVKSVIGGATIKSIAIQSQANGLAGDVTIDLNAETAVAVVADAAAKEIVLDCCDAALSTSEYTSFYAVLPATEFAAGDLKIVYTVNYDGNDVVIEYPVQGAMLLGAGVMKWTQITISESFNGTTTDIETATSQLQAAINAGNVVLQEDVTTNKYLTVTNDVNIDLNGKTLEREGTTGNKTVLYATAGDVTIQGDGTVKGASAIWATGTSSFVVKGGHYIMQCTDPDNGTGYPLIYSKGGAITIEGGKFESNVGDDVSFAGDQYNLLNVYGNSGGSIVVKGGEFKNFNPANNYSEGANTSFVAEGYKVINKATGEEMTAAHDFTGADIWYQVVIADLQSAIAAGGNVTLDSDVILTDYIDIRNEVTINLNGNKIIHPASSSAKYKDVFEVYENGKLTIEGEGEIIAEDGYCIYAAGNSTVVLNGGYYFSCVTIVDARKNACVTINGGEYKVDGTNNPDGDFGQTYTLNLRDKTGSYASDESDIIVKGGKFYKFNPADNTAEGANTNFVADGYQSVQSGDYWIVSKQ